MSIAKIMLVDDEESFLDVMTKRLSMRDLTVMSASGGEQALKNLAQDNTIDVVILDVKMPGMDGIETLRAIKADYPLVEVLMLTGHATVENAIDGMKQGAFDYLMKPCNIDQLVGKVADAKKKKAAHEEKIMQAQLKEITGRYA